MAQQKQQSQQEQEKQRRLIQMVGEALLKIWQNFKNAGRALLGMQQVDYEPAPAQAAKVAQKSAEIHKAEAVKQGKTAGKTEGKTGAKRAVASVYEPLEEQLKNGVSKGEIVYELQREARGFDAATRNELEDAIDVAIEENDLQKMEAVRVKIGEYIDEVNIREKQIEYDASPEEWKKEQEELAKEEEKDKEKQEDKTPLEQQQEELAQKKPAEISLKDWFEGKTNTAAVAAQNREFGKEGRNGFSQMFPAESVAQSQGHSIGGAGGAGGGR